MKRILTIAIGSMIAGGAAWLLACGPFTTDLQPVLSHVPADEGAYAKGDLGVVRPAYSLGYLVQAYRTLTPRPAPLPDLAPPDVPQDGDADPPDPVHQWAQASAAVLGTTADGKSASVEQSRHVPGDQYQTFDNCPDAAFANALKTLQARRDQFGASSPQVRDWVRAQTMVFENCHDGPLVAPPPADPSDAATRADRDYQIAAAHFYAMDYKDAVVRFRAIAADAASAWRPLGRYLAGRANIRYATVSVTELDRDRLASAETDLRAAMDDRAAAIVHQSARGLLGFISARLHAIERLHELSARLTAAAAPDEQDLIDYRFVLPRALDPRLSSAARSAIVGKDDLTDWLVTMSGGDEVAAHAIERWRGAKAPHWLVAALWKARLPFADADALLDAARALPRQSPAFPTVAFLRVRLLTALGRSSEARAVLAALPSRPSAGFGPETINLLKAERLTLAENLDQFLVNAPRAIVVQWTDPKGYLTGTRLAVEARSHDDPVLDEDAATILAERLPLTRLVDAALSTRLPPRLRLRVAIAAFTRAIVLHRDAAGARLVPVLRAAAPALNADLDRYQHAANAADRYRAGVFFLLNTPGATVDVRGLEDDFWFEVTDPARAFDHLFRRNWWCESQGHFHHTMSMNAPSETVGLLYPGARITTPPFITAAERDAAERERQAILAEGPPGTFLLRAAIRLSTERPDDPAVPEILARVVDGWRWTCHAEDNSSTPLPQQAFAALHRRFPASDAAQRTKYWYRD